MTLIKDETAPEIQGADDVTILQGKTMDFLSGITVKDDMDPEPEFKADYKQVDLNAPGTSIQWSIRQKTGRAMKTSWNVKLW